MQHNIFFFGTQEPLTEFLIEKLMPQGGTFVDVGANIGLMSVVAGLRAGPKGRVVAIEPAPIIAKRLEENLCLNNLQADVVQVAAWDRVGDLALEYPVGPIEHWGVTGIPFPQVGPNQGITGE
jgi:precorrin-6B methylase 2